MRKDSYPKLARGSRIALGLWMLALAGCELFDSGTDAEHLARAQALHDRGDLGASVIELKNALQKNPANGEARVLLGRTQAELGQGAAAEKELRRAIELRVPRADLTELLAEALRLQGKHAELLAEIVPGESLPPGARAELHARRGDAWLALHKPDQAKAEYETVLKIAPDSAPGKLGLARLAALGGNFGEAQRLTAEALAKNPEDPAAWSFQAGLWETANEFPKAEDGYTKAMALHRLNQSDRAGRALVRIRLDKLEEARADIDTLKREAPDLYLTRYAEGLLDLRQGKPAEAQAAFEASERLNPRFSLTQYQLGLVHLVQNHPAQAERYLSRFLQAAPGSLGGVELMALTQFRQKDFAGVKHLLAPVLKSRPGDVLALRLMGEAEIALGDGQSGIAHLQEAVNLDPKSVDARQDFGLRLLAQGATAQGLAELEAAAALDPGSAQPDIWITLAQLRAGKFDQALAAIDRIRARAPDGEVADSLLGLLRLAQNDRPAARESFQRALAKQPGDPALSHQLAQLALKEGKPDEARRLYSASLKAHPGHLSTEIELARLDALTGRLGPMADRMDALIREHPEALQPRLIRAEYLLKLGQPDRAQVLLEPIQSHYPRQPELLALLTQAQIDNGRARLALNTAKSLVEAAPKAARSHYLLALAQGENGDTRAMRKSLEQALALEPGFAPARLAEVRALAIDKKYPEAEARLKQWQQEHPDDPDLLSLRGWYASLRGRPDEAARVYRRLLETAPGTQAATQLAQAQWRSGDQAGAIATLERWTESHPDDSFGRYLLAGLYRAMDRAAEARKQLESVLEISPNNAPAMNDLAWLLRTSDSRRALEWAERATQAAPQSPQALDTLAAVLMDQGRDREAVEVLRRAVALDPGNPSLAYRLALALNKAGRTEDSRKAIESLLSDGQAFPERKEALDLLKRMMARKGG